MRERIRMTAPAVPLSVGAGRTQGSVALDAVTAAGKVMAKFVDQQNAQQRERKGPAGLKSSGCLASQPHGHRSLSRTTGGMPSAESSA